MVKTPQLTALARRLGADLLHDPHLNKGTAFTEEERDRLRLRGLLPPRVFSETEQEMRVLENFRRKSSPLERYIFLSALKERNETLFYRVLIDHIGDMMPVVYTPTVGQACQEFGHIFQRAQGLFVSAGDRGRIAEVLRNWPERDVRVIVVTDGERILGLGDLGANGMGIPVGKLTLYTACAGVDPRQCLPVTLDVGTNNEELLKDPLYIGTLRHRLFGAEYDELIDEFMTAVDKVFPHAVVQFEDFANSNAFRLLTRYRDAACCFNDDIQGTASVTLAGIYSGLRITEQRLADQRFLFLGAGEAGIGIGDLIVAALGREGVDAAAARKLCWFVDSRGLVVGSRGNLEAHKLGYAHDHPPLRTLLEAVQALRPTVLIGVSGQPQTFTRPVLEALAEHVQRPMVFALSNPTSKAECTASDAYEWTGGRAIFASGSPFDPVTFGGRTFVPGQGNNAYIFPGVGLGVVLSGARRVVDEMFAVAARTLAQRVTRADLERGCIYPPLSSIREVSAHIAAATAEVAFELGLATVARPSDTLKWVKAGIYEPNYMRYA
ncbi:MAG: NAD-dependent malic enzyme [Planctomycetota bacterium]